MNLTHPPLSSSALDMLSHFLLSMRENTTTKEITLSLQEEQNKLRQMVGLLTQVRKLECERHPA
jgi:hypothetical protein